LSGAADRIVGTSTCPGNALELSVKNKLYLNENQKLLLERKLFPLEMSEHLLEILEHLFEI